MIQEMAAEKDQQAKKTMKRYFDKNTKEREFTEGSMVLVRCPELRGKLDDHWDGPYEVTRKITPVTYELAVHHRRAKVMVVHINSLKPWIPVEAPALRVVVADDEPEVETEGATAPLDTHQQKDIQDILNEFSDVVTTKVGVALGVQHHIDTGQTEPIRVPPHQLASYWRDQIRQEIADLLKAGIIRSSRSPWSSPIVQ